MQIAKVRVLVIDDSVVIRRIISVTLASDPAIEVVGTAADGSIALARIAQLSPDVVTLDLEMPGMDGFETMRAIRAKYPKLPVLVFSTLAQRGAEATFDALAMGANDYVRKPSTLGGASASAAEAREELTRKVKGLGGVLEAPSRSYASGASKTTGPAALHRGTIEVVAIGTSTGGPTALGAVLGELPAGLRTPIVVVQHMPPHFTRILAERLDSQCAVRVREAEDGMPIEPGGVYIAPGDYHLEVAYRGGRLVAVTHAGPPENSCRPAVDVLFRSVAKVFRSAALGVVLTGMGRDGYRGAQLLKEAGARILAQDQATSVVWGMPGIVAEAGLADDVLPIERVASAILQRLQLPRTLRVSAGPLADGDGEGSP